MSKEEEEERNEIYIGDIEIPITYFNLSEEEKKNLCTDIIATILHLLNSKIKKEHNKLELLEEILKSSMITNERTEEFEICGVFQDCLKFIDEYRNHKLHNQ